MRSYFRLIIFTAAMVQVFAVNNASGQEQQGMVRYTPDFRFRDGVYVNFDQVKQNNPIPKARLLTSTDYNDKEFFKKLLESEKIYYYDGMGIRQEIDVDNIWGYARNGVIYIQVQNNFNRITFVGSICHFVADDGILQGLSNLEYVVGYSLNFTDSHNRPGSWLVVIRFECTLS